MSNPKYQKLTNEQKISFKEAIEWALEDLSKNGWENKNNSTGYDVSYDELEIPPKQVISKTFEFLAEKGHDISFLKLYGGNDINTFLSDCGLNVISKSAKIKSFSDLIIQLSQYLNNNKSALKIGSEKSKNYVWLTDQQMYFDESDAHYELFLENKTKEISVDLHFEKGDKNQLIKLLGHLPEYLEWKKWQTSKAVTHVNKYNLGSKNLLSHLVTDIEKLFDYTYPLLIDTLKKRFPNKNYMPLDHFAQSTIDLLKYKKQIILQGPPGTGKTRLAKQIAKQILIETLKKSISKEDILSVISEGLVISTHTDYNTFEIKKINPDGVKVYPKDAKNEYAISFTDIIDCLKDYDSTDLVKKHDKKGIGTYIVGLAKYIISKLDINQSKIIQFHPSYSYEDFVRGIVAKPSSDGDGIIYEAENKVLASFCKDAHQNFLLSNVKAKTSISDIELFKDFISNLADKITDSDEQRWSLTDAVYLFAPDEKRFKYKGDNWIAHAKGLNMKFSELEKILLAGITERAQIKKLDTLEELTKQHASYFIKVIELFYEYKKTHSSSSTSTIKATALRNYILIIDEINRANLSSVLGELIYALEYRGEEVESLYEVDGSSKMVVPPNLYIIGTMNTADRSVGHIDYAIRRRFAFVDVEPQDLSEALGSGFDQVSYLKVASLFNHDTYLSKEFDAKDVQLGHSYFIDKTAEGGTMKVRLKYEIKPILLEYVKDGILIGDGIVAEIEAL